MGLEPLGGGVPGLASKGRLTETEKARRRDELIHALRQPGVRNTYVRQVPAGFGMPTGQGSAGRGQGDAGRILAPAGS
jgi:hypothetical protein